MQRIRFPTRDSFYTTLRARVDATLAAQGRPRTGGWRLALKTAFILALTAIAYVALVFRPHPTLWEVALLSIALSQGIVLIGFCVMHDAGHGAMSSRRWVNALFGRCLDLIGGNQTLWQRKHNVLHHTYTNLEPWDDDLETGGRMRLHPEQPWKPHHRHQARWFPALYCLLALHWFASDFPEYRHRRVGQHAIPEPSRLDQAIFWAGKLLWITLALVLPLALHPVWAVLLTGLVVYLLVGFTLALVFQLAHVVDRADFPSVDADGRADDSWAVHQLATTVNFATENPFVTWYTGGLNHQIEHHLFSRVSHVHYGAIRPVVKATCEEFGVCYREYPTVREAIAGHVRQLRTLSREPAAT